MITDIHDYPKNKFIRLSPEPASLSSFIYKTHSTVLGMSFIPVKNANVSSGLLNFYDLRLGEEKGIHVGYYIETPYSVNVACNFLTLMRKAAQVHDRPQLRFKLPSVCIYTLGTSSMVLVSDTVTHQSLANTIMV